MAASTTARRRPTSASAGATRSPPATGWQFTSEAGGFYQGKGTARLVSVGCTASATICQSLARDVAVEQVKFGDQVQEVPRIYPVLRAAVSYRF